MFEREQFSWRLSSTKQKVITIIIPAVIMLLLAVCVSYSLGASSNKAENKTSKSKSVPTTTNGVEKFKELAAIETTSTTTTTTAPKVKTTGLDEAIVKKCAQGFYDALAYYDTYRLIFNTMYSAKVLDSQEMEDQALKEREELEVTVGELYQVLQSSCSSYVGNRWLDNRWG